MNVWLSSEVYGVSGRVLKASQTSIQKTQSFTRSFQKARSVVKITQVMTAKKEA